MRGVLCLLQPRSPTQGLGAWGSKVGSSLLEWGSSGQSSQVLFFGYVGATLHA